MFVLLLFCNFSLDFWFDWKTAPPYLVQSKHAYWTCILNVELQRWINIKTIYKKYGYSSILRTSRWNVSEIVRHYRTCDEENEQAKWNFWNIVICFTINVNCILSSLIFSLKVLFSSSKCYLFFKLYMKLKHIYNGIHEFYRVISNHPAIKLIESIYMYMLRSNKKNPGSSDASVARTPLRLCCRSP